MINFWLIIRKDFLVRSHTHCPFNGVELELTRLGIEPESIYRLKNNRLDWESNLSLYRFRSRSDCTIWGSFTQTRFFPGVCRNLSNPYNSTLTEFLCVYLHYIKVVFLFYFNYVTSACYEFSLY